MPKSKSTAKATAKPAFTPNPEQLALLPDISGNSINGLGETAVRRPTPIYWQDSDKIAHGKLQDWFYAHGRTPKATKHREGTMKLLQEPLPPVAPGPTDKTPQEWTAAAKEVALASEADRAGVAHIDPNWVYEGAEVNYPWAIVVGVSMEYGPLSQAPSTTTQVEVHKQYARGARAAVALARWIREQGFDAKAHGGPRAGPMLLLPAAIAAGFGELGKHGSMINRQYGSLFRLAYVMTDMPLMADSPDDFGADGFCTNCRVCTRACPVDAIHEEKQMVRGHKKWFVNFDKCVLYFNENNGCAICIAACPWSKIGTAPRLAEKLIRRRMRNP
ncbi:MAG: 4Fe-4S dicluster domain-containing protein [Rhodospirillales bacterium]|nr:4Fe-4S dicluster domain-containing protein [Rhodospirillales bacterium]